MFLCNECDETYASCGDDSGICEGCRESIEARRCIDAMSEDEYVAWKASHTIANDNRPAAEQTGRDIAKFFKMLAE